MHRHALRRFVWVCLVAWSISGSAGAEAPTAYARGDAAPAARKGERPAWSEPDLAGPPYEADRRRYAPAVDPGYEQTGMASWYGARLQGRATASGEAFDQHALTGAHPTLPIPSMVQVTNLENGREVTLRINDRGPFDGSRLIDVSRAAAEALGFTRRGEARVRLRYLGPAPRGADAGPAGSAEPWAMPEQRRHRRSHPSWDEPDLAGGPVGPSDRYASRRGGFVVQVGAFAFLDNAERARDIARPAGPVRVDIIRTAADGELFRVRVGPWPTRAQANAARRRLVSLGFPDAFVAAR